MPTSSDSPGPGLPRRIRRVSEVASSYDAVLCDVWGVIHDGRAAFPEAAEALRGLRRSGLVVVLLTNVPRPSSTLPSLLARLGFPDDAWDEIVTSGDAIRVELARRAPGPMLRLGRDTDAGLWEGLGLELASLSKARFMAIAGLRDRAETPEAYTEVLRAARARDLELLCANPDVQVMVGGELAWCAGAVAQQYAAQGGRVVQAGKPHTAIYARARDVLARCTGAQVPNARILAIGDGIPTDILGANRQGLDSLFIGTGMHGTSLISNGHLDTSLAQEALASAGVTATYAMTVLA